MTSTVRQKRAVKGLSMERVSIQYIQVYNDRTQGHVPFLTKCAIHGHRTLKALHPV